MRPFKHDWPYAHNYAHNLAAAFRHETARLSGFLIGGDQGVMRVDAPAQAARSMASWKLGSAPLGLGFVMRQPKAIKAIATAKITQSTASTTMWLLHGRPLCAKDKS